MTADVRAAADRLAALDRVWQRELGAVVQRWIAEIRPQQLASLSRQIEHAVLLGDVQGLAAVSAPVLGAELLLTSARTMAAAGADAVVREAKDAGVPLEPPPPLAAVSLAAWAAAAARRLADAFTGGVIGAALQRFRPGSTPAQVTEGVNTYVGELTDRGIRDVAGGLLTQAQNLGRLQVYSGPLPPGASVTLVADETLDNQTCGPCRAIDGTVLPTPEAAALAYGGAGYLFCRGGPRCRGTVRGDWEYQDPQRAQFVNLLGELAALRPGA